MRDSSYSKLKRGFDWTASFLGLILLSPLFFLIALAISIDDGSPVFFLQERVGLKGKRFKMWKFRTMVVDGDKKGKLITVAGDRRITRVGLFLRKTKLDELPQLFNVLKGEMSFVGPRPEVSRYVELYTPAQKKVLEILPGITDPASLRYRSESELLAQAAEPEKFYIEKLMPDKIEINLHYFHQATLWSDIRVIFETFGVMFK